VTSGNETRVLDLPVSVPPLDIVANLRLETGAATIWLIEPLLGKFS
jgi:hypothetical protein